MNKKDAMEIIKKYYKRFENHNEIASPILNKLMSDGRTPYDELFNGLFKYYIICDYILSANIIPKTPKDETIRQLFASASKSFFSVAILLQNGIPSSAAVVLRQLFETFLNLKLILKEDTENRINLYENFIFAARQFAIDRDRKLIADGKITKEEFDKHYTKEQIDETKTKFEKIKDDYSNASWCWKFMRSKGNGSGSIKEIAREVDCLFDYDKVYGILSKIAHSNKVAMIFVGKTSAPVFDKSIIETLSFLALGYMSHVFKLVAEHYCEPKESEEYEMFSDYYCLELTKWDKE